MCELTLHLSSCQASKRGVLARSTAMRSQFQGESVPKPPSHFGRLEWKPYLARGFVLTNKPEKLYTFKAPHDQSAILAQELVGGLGYTSRALVQLIFWRFFAAGCL